MTLRALPSGQSRDPPDGRPLRLAHQNHFGSQCAPQSVYWHLPAKVKLKKSHFGKPPLTECALRHPPCQSELAETPSEPAIHPEGNAIHGLVEGTISSEMERSVRRVSFAESNNKNTLLQEMEKRHEHGVYITKKRCAELDEATRLRLDLSD